MSAIRSQTKVFVSGCAQVFEARGFVLGGSGVSGVRGTKADDMYKIRHQGKRRRG